MTNNLTLSRNQNRRFWMMTISIALMAFGFILIVFVAIFAPRGGDPRVLTGSWGTSSDPRMTAVVADSTVTVLWDTGEEKALYWKGTFNTSKTVGDGGVVVSQGDHNAMESSLMGSQDDSKSFVYKDGTLQFELTVLGVTQTIKLDPQS
jgi:hypothetical protein